MIPPRPTVTSLTDEQRETYRPVPPAGPGVCDLCHGAPNPSFSRCFSCARTASQVSHPADLIVPISLSSHHEQLGFVLRRYKDSSDPSVRDLFSLQLAALLGRFVHDHGGCVASRSGPWDAVTIVPSTAGRAGAHPLSGVVDLVAGIVGPRLDTLATSAVPAHHNQAGDAACLVTTDVGGRRLLLLDDTLTTGARIQSAASTLTGARATVVATIVLGRFVNPEFNNVSRELLDRSRRRGYRFEECCLCSAPW